MKNKTILLFVMSAALLFAACSSQHVSHVSCTASDWITVSNPLASHSLQVPQDWSFNYRESWGGFQIINPFRTPMHTSTFSWGDNSNSDFVPLDTDSWPGDMLLDPEKQVDDFVFNDGSFGMQLVLTDFMLFARINEERGEIVVLFISIEDVDDALPDYLVPKTELMNIIGATLTFQPYGFLE